MPTKRTAPTPVTSDRTAAIDDLLALDQQVCYALSVASRTVIGLYRPLLEPMNLTHPQYLVMLALWEEAPLKANVIARKLQLQPATLSPLLKRLEASGYIRRDRDPRDDRALAIDLTERGRLLRNDAVAIPPAIIQSLGMPVEELVDLHARLLQVIAAATEAPKPVATTRS
ncbi:MarR family winged helix-turn-helix transcriptional regulator [Nocardioides daejeonensis]|uniref:MarR family winged helix-turn-helix transcriptional regulator n=1 Tax=Nocardioides daejeonensis TaxID=1046556 RepID=UPI000D74EEB3|nr:MarR family transcriptional regulator [Nocardioides daejeonensis]